MGHDADETREEPRGSELSFSGLLERLRSENLEYSPETVGNYLLALQTKRFVILTGLSGTGKTRLAISVAKYFQPRVTKADVENVPEGASLLEVQPYMFQHHRMTLPAAIRAQLKLQPPDPGTRGGGRLDVFYPSGEAKLAFWRDPDTNSNSVFFKGPFKDWFKSSLYPGAKLILKVRESAVEGIDALEISLPAVKTQTAPVENCCVIAVRPDWTDGHGILGYFNPLTNRYVPSRVLRFLLDANREIQRASVDHRAPYPYFLILDEMNLAHVEQYFSDFLSCMESDEEIQLHEDQATEQGANEDDLAIPRRISIPPNVFFTGTVNVDETTYMFSPKVLDRAFTIELKDVDLRNFGSFNNTKEEGLLIQKLLPLAFIQLPSLKDWNSVANVLDGEVREKLIALNDLLAKYGLHFGYRVATEIACFVRLANDQTDGSSHSIWAALDVAILEKILPKFHGTQEELDEPLRHLFAFAEKGQPTKEPPSWDSIKGTWERGPSKLISMDAAASGLFFPRTARKIFDMLVRVHQQGFATYIV